MAGRLARIGWVLGIAAVGVTVTLGARHERAASAPAVQATAPSPQTTELASPEVLRVAPRDLTRTVRFSGSTLPATRQRIDAEVAGRLREVRVDVGDHVEQGALLALVDTDQLQSTLGAREATLEAREAQRRLAQTTLDRARRLGTAGISSEASLLSAEADLLNLDAQVRALQADVADAQRALEDSHIVAPFDGAILSRSVEPGQSVAVGAAMFEMVDPDTMEIDALVPASRIAEVRIGQSARIRIEGLSGDELQATVARIAPGTVEGTRAVRVFLSLGEGTPALRGGMFATGEIELERFPDVIALPAGALRRDGEGAFVLKAESGRVLRQDVTEGARFPEVDLVEIRSGVREGDVVVTAPLPDLQPDTAVTIADLS